MTVESGAGEQAAFLTHSESLRTTSRCPVDHLEPQLAQLVDAIHLPHNQGEALTRTDYALLLLTTIALPVLLILVGRML